MRLPYFPLHVVLFLPLPLHIFEERYRATLQIELSRKQHLLELRGGAARR